MRALNQPRRDGRRAGRVDVNVAIAARPDSPQLVRWVPAPLAYAHRREMQNERERERERETGERHTCIGTAYVGYMQNTY